ncbi:MAG: protoheme IX farnesyltransferase [Chloroflexia bacterium]|nr:protoheme IX farnesyltransferase [Chloroflexia bacterium]
MNRLGRLALSAAVVMVLAVMLGGLARMTGAEPACSGTWPRCDGSWVPAFAAGPLIDYLHGFSLALSLLIAVVTALLTRRAAATSRWSRLIAWSAVGLLAGARIVSLAAEGSGLAESAHAAGPLLAMTLLGMFVALCWSLARDSGFPEWLARLGQVSYFGRDPLLVWMTGLAVASLLLVIASGARSGNGLPVPCPSWPLCVDDRLVPDQPTAAIWLHLGHRGLSTIAAVAVIAIAVRAWTKPAAAILRRLSLGAAGLLVVQILLGGDFVTAGGPVWLGMLHLVAGAALWLTVVSLAIVAAAPSRASVTHAAASPIVGRRATPGRAIVHLNVPAAPGAALAVAAGPAAISLRLPEIRAWRVVTADYVALTKPGILILLLVTTFAAMLIAATGVPAFGLICVTIVGGALAAGGANVLNCYIDRDIDAQMTRTRHRATAANRIPPPHVLGFGIGLTALAIVLLGLGANWVASLLALTGNLYYVLVYTRWLKRRTPHNIVIGGAAGAVPPLVGWAAVTGELSPLAWALFAVIFMWTPPHFWALALLKQGEYGRAAVPMLPVVAGEAETRRQIVIYSTLLFLVCLMLVPLGLGPLYLVAAIIINAVFLGLALLLFWRPAKRLARRLFLWSLWYLALIFLAAVVDRLLLG